MAPWSALNIEPDSDVEEEEYDDTKEIQIEEALKLYQNALKLHSQGPSRFDEAEKAYSALFESEIFSYPESQSELRRIAISHSAEESDYEDWTVAPSGLLAASESAPNTLPQIIYLSCKNRGQFLLDRLVYRLTSLHPNSVEVHSDEEPKVSKIAEQSLRLLTDALDKDETDEELWRRIAKISHYLGTKRAARFALESSTADEDENDAFLLEGVNLRALMVQEELKDLLKEIQADVDDPKNLASVSSWKHPTRALLPRLDPLRVLSTSRVEVEVQHSLGGARDMILASEENWQSVGEVIHGMRKLEHEETGLKPGARYCISLPGDENQAMGRKLVAAEVHSKIRLSLSPTTPVGQPSFDQILGAVQQGKSPTMQKKSLTSDSISNKAETGDRAQEVEKLAESVEPSGTPIPKSSHEVRPLSKRSSEVAGLPDTPEGGRVRSKRLRARAETLAEDTAEQKILNKHHEEQMRHYAVADDWLFSVALEIGSQLGSDSLGDSESLREIASAESHDDVKIVNSSDAMACALGDFKISLSSWSSNKTNLLLNGTGSGASAVLIDNGAESGFAAFMEHSKGGSKRLEAIPDLLVDQGLSQFISSFTSELHSLDHMLLCWIQALLKPQRVPGSRRNTKNWLTSTYTRYAWSVEFKDLLTDVLVGEDKVVDAFVRNVKATSQSLAKPAIPSPQVTEEDLSFLEFTQTVFELHLDIYGKMVGPDSKIDQPTRAAQRDRISRWANLASSVLSQARLTDEKSRKAKELMLRHLWSYVVFIGLVEISARDHLLLCHQELKDLLETEGSSVYLLPNNAIMPEVSADALEREMSMEKTMDFFQSIFGSETQDPASLIESLEPILMGNAITNDQEQELQNRAIEIPDSQQEEDTQNHESLEDTDAGQGPAAASRQLLEFMQKATAQLRLSLWHQLKVAYDRINYPPMKMVCNFRSMDIILEELESPEYTSDKHEGRSANLIVWIRNLSDLISQCLEWVKGSSQALECLAEENLELSLRACSRAVRLFHTFALWEDSVRVQQLQQPSQTSTASPPHKSAMNFLRDIQPKVWQLLYILYREAASQEQSTGPNFKEHLLEYLRALHNTFGLREYCRVGKKSFLKFLKSELIRLDAPEEDVSQVLYDLYGLKITQNSSQLLDHGCTGDQIDRASALELVGFVVEQAKTMNMKDVLKSDLKLATERMQAVIGTPRASSIQQLSNRRNVTLFLKQPIVPTNLYKALRGLQGLTGQRVDTQYATVASKKWFFLVGQINLAKYRSVRRVAPDNSDDLDNAITFLKLDLDFDTESWETWFRLAQAYDAKIEEDIIWDTVTINERPGELVMMQKNSIHCYEMAVSLAMQFADGSTETRVKLADLYTDFANRIYASTRAPFDMKAFDTAGQERYVNKSSMGTYKILAFVPLSLSKAWKLAVNLYEMVLVERPDDWFIWYMLGKCRWKLFRSVDSNHFTSADCLETFAKAVKHVPEKRDSRHPEKEPVLDPHYKLVSTVYKLLRDSDLRLEQAVDILSISAFARKVNRENEEGWEKYILRVLYVLRNADKSNWHHRIVARIATIEYLKNPNSLAAAQAAKDKFTQHILTKTMGIQVWKPEFERAGRHFVYTSKYLCFIILLLKRLGERSTLEALGRRIRKKQNEFIEHTKIWMDLCQAHIKVWFQSTCLNSAKVLAAPA